MKEKTLTKLDKEIEQTLSSELPDSEKAVKYIAALRRYKYFDSPVKEEAKVDVEEDILSTVPITQRHKAKRLLEHLKRDTSVQIGEKGEFIYRQQKLPLSHVGELLNDVLQKKLSKGESPKGWRKFAETLKTLDVPRDLIENTDRWKYMHAPAVRAKKLKKPTPVPTREPLPRTRKRATPYKRLPIRWASYDDVK